MLDDLKVIDERDKDDCLGIAERQWDQLVHNFKVDQPPIQADNVVFAGMGGSALSAVIFTSWPGANLPFEVVRNYDIPAYVNKRTYLIASSYSGNTEETLSALAQAEQAGAQIAVIAGGGQLAEIAKAKGYPLAVLPRVFQPRFAALSGLKALITLLSEAGLIEQNYLGELTAAAELIKSAAMDWQATKPTSQNLAKQIAQDCIGKSVVIYGGPKLWPAAYKWKISFNENAKQIAWANQYSEFNHNEFMGWTKQPVNKPYTVIDLRSNLENDRIQKRFVISAKLLSGQRPEPIVVEAVGKNLIEQLVWTITLGDFVTMYTAILSGLNPGPVELIEKLKKELG